MRNLVSYLLAFFFCAGIANGQSTQKIELGKTYNEMPVSQDISVVLHLDKGATYAFNVLQRGIDVVVILYDKDKRSLVEQDSPNGSFGPETFEYKTAVAGDYTLVIRRLDEAGNPREGNVNLAVRVVAKSELAERERIKKELEPENRKTVQTADIDHFWQAFDNLKNCRTHADSVGSFQRLYINRATDGFIDFLKARSFTAEEYVQTVAKLPKFYASIRPNTYEVKNAAPLIEETFARFKELYPNFKPFKVCFAIGTLRTGGTVSDKFVLIGSEISTSTKHVDLSELNGSAMSKVMAQGDDIVQKIKNIVAHESVHTQQGRNQDSTAIRCDLLYACMSEGFCDFIGELIAQGQINKVAQEYGDAHEEQLWQQFKAEMCGTKAENWLYNFATVKDKPADLGYYIGYKIARAYYEKATDKKKAIIDILELRNPLDLLEKSGYDRQVKKKI